MKVRRCADCKRRAETLDEYSNERRVRRILCLGCLTQRRWRGENWLYVR